MIEEYIQVVTAVEKKDDAEKIANVLVEKRLAGCVQIVGSISSIYRWEGKIEAADEWLCFVKSKKNLYDEIEKTIKEIHPYKTPEIIATPIVAGSKDFFEWLDSEVKK